MKKLFKKKIVAKGQYKFENSRLGLIIPDGCSVETLKKDLEEYEKMIGFIQWVIKDIQR